MRLRVGYSEEAREYTSLVGDVCDFLDVRRGDEKEFEACQRTRM